MCVCVRDRERERERERNSVVFDSVVDELVKSKEIDYLSKNIKTTKLKLIGLEVILLIT